MRAISREMADGVKDFMQLQTMIGEVLAASGHPGRRSAAPDRYGYDFDDARFFVGVYLQKPNIIVFEMHQAFMLGNIGALAKGEIRDGSRWVRELDIQSPDLDFFGRNRFGQMACIDRFLSENLRYISKLERSIAKPRNIDIDILREFDRDP